MEFLSSARRRDNLLVVVPFHQCLARPNDGTRIFELQPHLEAVATTCGNKEGTPEDRLAFLAGLLHDAAKANARWQDYIKGYREGGPPHAPLGSALFAFCADSLIPTWTGDRGKRESLQDLALDWSRVVYDHHGKLGDLDSLPPWEMFFTGNELLSLLEGCDTFGLFGLVTKHFQGFEASNQEFQSWLEHFGRKWEQRIRFVRNKLLRQSMQNGHKKIEGSVHALRLPQIAARLIRADRYHAAGFQRSKIEAIAADQATECLEAYLLDKSDHDLKAGADPKLVKIRGEVKKSALETYQTNSTGNFFTLLLPTGYGKTLTGLSVALEACRTGRCERIVYVAPYLSILSQAAYEMSTATGLDVFQHHHLTLAELADDEDMSVLDTWQAPVLATTFNQLFRALFPDRVQESLRTEALHRTFIIVDEPQIVDLTVWNLFLKGLAIATCVWDSQILFSTATLPPIEAGLEAPLICLGSHRSSTGRFNIKYDDRPHSAGELASLACKLSKDDESVALVVNTVRDAVQVFNLLKERLKNPEPFCLTAMMLPGHKAMTIEKIRQHLANNDPVIVVCTQILEAGVNLSFRWLLRALPIFPSVVQVAGRANRHGEGKRSTVILFPFLRDDGKDTRAYVYRDETARRQTDRIFAENPEIDEESVGTILKTYFDRCWQENRYTACLTKFEQAARGCWSALSGLDPFGGDVPNEEVFVPISGNWAVHPKMESLMTKFAPDGPEQLLERYSNKFFRHELSFTDRKRLQALLQQYTVSVPPEIAQKIADPVNQWLWRLSNIADYSPETGFAHLLDRNITTSPRIL